MKTDACPLFILSDVLLEDKQKFKHGGVDKCHTCMGIFNYLDSILGLICIILRFMPIFLRFWLVSPCSGFFIVDLRLMSQAMGEKHEVEAQPS